METRLQSIETTVLGRLDNVEKLAENAMDEVLEVKKTIPDLAQHIESLAEHLALQTLKIDVHRRKWNVVIHGIEGNSGESEQTTRNKVKSFATNTMGLDANVVNNTRLNACHRLSQKKNAGIILRFADLAERDACMASWR